MTPAVAAAPSRPEPELPGQTVVVIGGSSGSGLATARGHVPTARNSSRGPPKPVDHVMVTAGRPHYGRLLEMKFDELRDALGDPILLATEVARNAADRVRPGGTLLCMSAV